MTKFSPCPLRGQSFTRQKNLVGTIKVSNQNIMPSKRSQIFKNYVLKNEKLEEENFLVKSRSRKIAK